MTASLIKSDGVFAFFGNVALLANSQKVMRVLKSDICFVERDVSCVSPVKLPKC